MPDRAIVARLRAEASQFIATMGKAAKSTRQVGEESEKASRKASSSFSNMAKKVRDNSRDLDRMGNSALVAGGAITAGLGFGIKAFADFDQAMSGVNAALPDAADKMGALRDIAIKLGADTQFSATEAAQGITELGKAGVEAGDILGGGLKGSLDLAASGQLAVADAAEIAATAMVQFKREGSDVPHIADLLAAGAGKAQGSVADLGAALNQAGLVANGMGVSLEETTGTLAAFAAAGLVGSDAGTSLKTMIQRLQAPVGDAKEMLDKYNISAYDTNDQFVGLANVAGQLQTKLKDLTPEIRNQALAVIFGSDAVRGANVLYEQGATGIAKWTGEVNDAGFAAEQAAKLTDNLKGDLERLGGSIDSVFVQNGEGANSALRGLVQGLEGAVDAVGALPGPVVQGGLALAGITGAGLLAVGAFAKVATTGADLVESMEALRVKSPKVAKGLDATATAGRKAAKAMLILAAAGAAVEWATTDTSSIGTEQLTNQLLGAAGAVDTFSASIRKNAADMGTIQDDLGSFGDVLETSFDPGFWDSFDAKGDAALKTITLGMLDLDTKTDEAAQRMGELDSVLSGLAGSGNGKKAADLFDQFADAAQAQGISVDQLKTKLPLYAEALAAADNQQKLAGGSAENMATDVEKVGAAADEAQDKVSDLADEIRGFGQSALDADEAEAAFRDAIDNVSKTVKDNAKAVEDGEKTKAQARRDNEGALRDLAKAGLENAAATLEATGSEEKAAASMKTSRAEFIKSAGALGIKGEAAEDLADKYGLIPEDVKTTVRQEGAAAARTQVQNLIDTIKRLNDKTVKIRYVVTGTKPGGGRSTAGGSTADADGGIHVKAGTGLVRAFADGGTIGSAQPQIRAAGGEGILWAETGAGPWEAFISGHPNKRPRSRMIAEDTVARLGGRISWARPFADGGILGGGGPTSVSETTNQPVNIYGGKFGPTLADIEREARQRARFSSLTGGNK